MASHTATRSVHKTLSGTTADTVAITAAYPALEVCNRDATVALYVARDGTTAVSAADNTDYVAPGGSLLIPHTSSLSVVGNGNAYSVSGVDDLD